MEHACTYFLRVTFNSGCNIKNVNCGSANQMPQRMTHIHVLSNSLRHFTLHVNLPSLWFQYAKQEEQKNIPCPTPDQHEQLWHAFTSLSHVWNAVVTKCSSWSSLRPLNLHREYMVMTPPWTGVMYAVCPLAPYQHQWVHLALVVGAILMSHTVCVTFCCL